jgi:Family of unknown function (DUF5675)
MPDHRLDRLFTAAGGTFGRLTSSGGGLWATLEREWRGNRPQVSCIPSGRYQLAPWSSKRWPRARVLVGDGVGIVPGPGITRSAILIHPANAARELKGCIALGTLDASRSMLTGSRAAVRAFLDELDATPGPHWLEIHGGDTNGPGDNLP